MKKEGSNAVYTMSASIIDKMLQTDAFSVINSFICIPNIEGVDKINIDIGGTPYTMEIKRSTVTSDDGTQKTEAVYYYNGNVVTEGDFKNVYQAMISASYDAEIKGAVAGSKEPYMTISYHITGENENTVTASYLPYDDNFYLVDTGSTIRFFADKRKIDNIANTIMEFKAAQ